MARFFRKLGGRLHRPSIARPKTMADIFPAVIHQPLPAMSRQMTQLGVGALIDSIFFMNEIALQFMGFNPSPDPLSLPVA